MQKSRIDPEELKRLLEEDKSPGRIQRICEHFQVCRQQLLKAIRKAGLKARPHVVDMEVLAEMLRADRLHGRYARIAKALNSKSATLIAIHDRFPDDLRKDTETIIVPGTKGQRGVQRQRQKNGVLNKTKNYHKDPRQNLCREAMHRAIDKKHGF